MYFCIIPVFMTREKKRGSLVNIWLRWFKKKYLNDQKRRFPDDSVVNHLNTDLRGLTQYAFTCRVHRYIQIARKKVYAGCLKICYHTERSDLVSLPDQRNKLLL